MSSFDHHKYRWWTLACLVLSLLIISFDVTVLNVALPTLSKELDAGTNELQWIMDSYLLVFSVLLLPAGSLGDRFGRKKMLFIGLIIFAITSLVAGFARTTDVLIVARAFMGVGGAIIMPLTFSILPTVFTPQEARKASAIWSASSGVGLLVGPLLGGFLIEKFSWGSIFFINVPIIAVVLIAGYFLIPESKNEKAHRIDWLSMLLSCIGLGSLVYGIIESSRLGWGSLQVILTLCAGTLFIALFIVRQKFAKEPMVNLSLFKHPLFTWATLAVCVIMFVLNGLLFFLTQYLQFTLDSNAYETGLRLIPFMAGMIVASLFSVRVASKLGTKWAIATGLLIMGIGLFLLSTIDVQDSYGFVAIYLVIQGVGFGLALSPCMSAVMESLPRTEVGIGSAVNNTLRQVSSALGVAVLGTLISIKYQNGINKVISDVPSQYVDYITNSIGTATKAAYTMDESIRSSILARINVAYIDGMDYTLKISSALLILCAVLIVVVLPKPLGVKSKEKAESHGPING
ncbi:MFS transporter [Paenibacillus lautus]|uniref:MFS transporter n=1 Tax=Paenibacillus lautus TaxID=1401 RepID=UPI003D28E0F0